MRFSIYKRFELDILREGGEWRAYRRSGGTRVPDDGIIIPADVEDHELEVFLDDLFHEYASPGEEIRRLA